MRWLCVIANAVDTPQRIDRRENPSFDLDLWEHNTHWKVRLCASTFYELGAKIGGAILIRIENNEHRRSAST